jgi:hypothetical protein
VQFTDILDRFSAAVEAGNGPGLAALFTETGVYDDYFFGPQQGRAAIVAMLEHFYEGGEAFRWEFHEPLTDGRTGYARYRFSYTSKAPGAEGQRVCFDGIGRFTLADGAITSYTEVFDRGMALAQQGYEPARLARIGLRYATALKARPEWGSHLHAVEPDRQAETDR